MTRMDFSQCKQYEGKGSHVALLYGGLSAEREVSLASGKYVLQALLKLGHKVSAIDPGVDFTQVLLNIAPDVVFNCLHGTYGEDGTIQGMLDMMQLPYTHSGARASYACFHKYITKSICEAAGINYPKWFLVKRGSTKSPMQPPYVIKPTSQGSSLGVEIIFPGEPGIEAYSFPYGDLAIVEEYIEGKEMQVCLFNGKSLGILELKYTKSRFFDYETKYTAGLAEHITPTLPEGVKEEILEVAEKFYALTFCRGLTRAEFIYSPSRNKSYFLEMNTHPGFTSSSLCHEIAALTGTSFEELVKLCLDSACFDKA